jgi:hypothetical protein
MKTPHKHADLIHAWADGAEIQVFAGQWFTDSSPSWQEDVQYRIKPEEKKPVVRWLWAYRVDGDWHITDMFLDESDKGEDGWVKLDWSRQEFPE